MVIGVVETHLGRREYVCIAEVLIRMEQQRGPQVVGGHGIVADQRSKSSDKGEEAVFCLLKRESETSKAFFFNVLIIFLNKYNLKNLIL